MINSPKKLRTQIYGTWAAALCLFFLLLLPTTQAQAYSGYVGESISLNAPSVPGTIGGASWTSDIGAVTVSGNHYGATAYINYYFTGTARVTLKYTYSYFNGSKTVYSSTQYAYYDITCKASTTTLNKRSVTMKPGQEVTLTYTNSSGYDAPSVVWNTSDYKIATIDGYKSVTGEKTVTVYAEDIGECTITCNANTGPTNPTCTIIVKGDPPTAVALPSTASTKVGESVTLTPTLTPSDAYAKFTWTSSNEAVATVSSSGKVTGKNVGTTTITVTTDNGLSAKSTITVGKASVTITADTESGVYTAGKKVTLKANRSDADIYYTLDGRTPTTSSTRYTAPITLSKSVMLKAIATGGNYETSDVLTREYTITSLTVKSYWSDIEEQNPYFIPTVTFSKTVNAHTNIEGITLSMGKTTIDGQALVQDGILFFVPDNTLSPGSYTLSIPENAVIDGVGDPNLATTLNLQIGKGIEPMAQQAAAGYSHSLAVKTDGSLWVWGSGLYGKLGTGNTSSISWPKKIMDDVAQVAAYTHSLFVKTDGSLWACGYNKYGQLGDGTTTDIKTPVKVKDGVRRVACGNYHTLIIKTDGSLWVCGFNEYGQLGDNTTTDRHNPVKIMDGVAQVAGGGYHTLIVKTDGSLWTCGLNNYGQLGDGTTTNRLMPVKIMDNVVQVAAGWRHSLAIKSDGSLWTWGLNGAGELGDGTKIDRYTPVKVMDDVAQASAQWYYSIAVKTDGTLWAWGRNYHGQFGDGTYTDRTSPKIIMDNVVQASAGNGHTLVIKKDGSLWACGDNDAGELGDGTTKDKSKFICVWDVSSFSKITGASLAKTSIQIAQGKQYLLLPVVTPTDGCIQNIAFESSDPSVATVSPRGIVKGVKNGTATITMTVDGKYTVTCTIKVGQGGATQLQLSASPAGGEVTAGTMVYLNTTNATGADIYYTLNGSTPSRNSTKYTSAGITISSDCTLKAIAYKDGYADSDVLTATYTVKSDPDGATGDGTLLNPFNAIAANKKAGELGVGETSAQRYYVKGMVSSIRYEFSEQYGTATFYISDDGTTSNQFYVYGSYYLENKPWVTGNPQIKIGDQVIVYGKMTNYNGILEMATHENYVYSHNGKTKVDQTESEGYYYVGNLNDWDITDKSHPFTKLSDDKTWELTMAATGGYDEFKIAIGETKEWNGNIFGVPFGNDAVAKSGTMTYDFDGSQNFKAYSESETYTIRIVPSTMHYEFVEKNIASSLSLATSSAGYATFFSSESAYTLPNGLSAQIVTSASNNKLTYKTIADGSVSGIVPKGTAVMLVSDDKQAGTYKLEPSESSVTYGGTNLLHGSDEATTTTGYGLYYKLSYGPTGTQWNDVFGWYWGAQNGAPFQIEGHKAWLVVPSSNGTRAAGFSIEGDVLGIESVEDPAVASDLYYDLQGRRVSQPAQKGFYIKNGKKVVLK